MFISSFQKVSFFQLSQFDQQQVKAPEPFVSWLLVTKTLGIVIASDHSSLGSELTVSELWSLINNQLCSENIL